MSEDTKRDENEFADPPDNTGGNRRSTLNPAEEGDNFADPPDNTGGGGKSDAEGN